MKLRTILLTFAASVAIYAQDDFAQEIGMNPEPVCFVQAPNSGPIATAENPRTIQTHSNLLFRADFKGGEFRVSTFKIGFGVITQIPVISDVEDGVVYPVEVRPLVSGQNGEIEVLETQHSFRITQTGEEGILLEIYKSVLASNIDLIKTSNK